MEIMREIYVSAMSLLGIGLIVVIMIGIMKELREVREEVRSIIDEIVSETEEMVEEMKAEIDKQEEIRVQLEKVGMDKTEYEKALEEQYSDNKIKENKEYKDYIREDGDKILNKWRTAGKNMEKSMKKAADIKGEK